MQSPPWVYKLNERSSRISPCSFELSYFKKLFEILSKLNKDMADIAIAKLQRTPGQSEEDFNAFIENARGLFKITVQIFGSKGEYIRSESPSIFDETYLPDSIVTVIFDNYFLFQQWFKTEPANTIKFVNDHLNPHNFGQ